MRGNSYFGWLNGWCFVTQLCSNASHQTGWKMKDNSTSDQYTTWMFSPLSLSGSPLVFLATKRECFIHNSVIATTQQACQTGNKPFKPISARLIWDTKATINNLQREGKWSVKWENHLISFELSVSFVVAVGLFENVCVRWVFRSRRSTNAALMYLCQILSLFFNCFLAANHFEYLWLSFCRVLVVALA